MTCGILVHGPGIEPMLPSLDVPKAWSQPLQLVPWFFFKSGYICFTILCQSLLHTEVNQLYVHIILSLGPPSYPSHPTCLSHHRAPSYTTAFPLASYLTHGGIYLSISIFQFIPLPFPPKPCPHAHFLHPCFYSCPANTFICIIFLDFTYMR